MMTHVTYQLTAPFWMQHHHCELHSVCSPEADACANAVGLYE